MSERAPRSAGKAAGGARKRSPKQPTIKAGRPMKLTAELQQRVVDALRSGCHIDVAARYAGIGKTTYYRWLALGREQPDGAYGEFLAAIEQAEAESEVQSLATLRRAFAQRPDMILAYLARRHPERWGRKAHRPDVQAAGPSSADAPALEIRNPDVRAHLNAALEASREEQARAQ